MYTTSSVFINSKSYLLDLLTYDGISQVFCDSYRTMSVQPIVLEFRNVYEQRKDQQSMRIDLCCQLTKLDLSHTIESNIQLCISAQPPVLDVSHAAKDAPNVRRSWEVIVYLVVTLITLNMRFQDHQLRCQRM